MLLVCQFGGFKIVVILKLLCFTVCWIGEQAMEWEHTCSFKFDHIWIDCLVMNYYFYALGGVLFRGGNLIKLAHRRRWCFSCMELFGAVLSNFLKSTNIIISKIQIKHPLSSCHYYPTVSAIGGEECKKYFQCQSNVMFWFLCAGGVHGCICPARDTRGGQSVFLCQV